MKVALLVLLGVIAFGQQIVPVPDPGDGYFVAPTNKTYEFTMDVFFDHLCSDSALAYPILMDFVASGSADLQLVIHIFPLPYHTYAFMVAEAGRFIQERMPSKFLNFMTNFFEIQDIFLQNAYAWNVETVQSKIASYTSRFTGASYEDLFNALKRSEYTSEMQVSWMYGASQGITGCPQYLINGVLVPEASTYNTETQWKTLFQSLKPN